LIRLVERVLRCSRTHLIHLQLGVDEFAFSPLLLTECFLCLRTRFEELRAQILDEFEGVVEQSSPMVERTRYNPAAAEEKVRFVVVDAGIR
jgi:hypothetical protein